jgi:hypothetical protein
MANIGATQSELHVGVQLSEYKETAFIGVLGRGN